MRLPFTMKKKIISFFMILSVALLCVCGDSATKAKEEVNKESVVTSVSMTQTTETTVSVSETVEEPVEEEPVGESMYVGDFEISFDRLTAVGGRYEQDGNTENGTEDIEWIVIKDDGDFLMLMSKYVLDCIGFNSSYAGTDWDNSYVRSFLNSDFYEVAFNESEKSIIKSYATTNIPASEGVEEKMVYDNVFLLSYEEVTGIFSDNPEGASELRQGPVSEYAKAKGVWYVKDEFYSVLGFKEREIPESVIGCGNWWLRTNGPKQTFAMDVAADGTIRTTGHDVGSSLDGIRPVIVIDISE